MAHIENEGQMLAYGERLGRRLKGGEIIELIGDVGAGKTTLVRGIAKGMAIDEAVQSPSFTISRVYESADGLVLAHYDFYRLEEPGIMAEELADTLGDERTVVIIEWSGTVRNILSEDRLVIEITAAGESAREMKVKAGGETSRRLQEGIDDPAA